MSLSLFVYKHWHWILESWKHCLNLSVDKIVYNWYVYTIPFFTVKPPVQTRTSFVSLGNISSRWEEKDVCHFHDGWTWYLQPHWRHHGIERTTSGKSNLSCCVFLVLCAPEIWLKHFFQPFSTFFLLFKPFSVISRLKSLKNIWKWGKNFKSSYCLSHTLRGQVGNLIQGRSNKSL